MLSSYKILYTCSYVIYLKLLFRENRHTWTLVALSVDFQVSLCQVLFVAGRASECLPFAPAAMRRASLLL
jgi:hypothetical protein